VIFIFSKMKYLLIFIQAVLFTLLAGELYAQNQNAVIGACTSNLSCAQCFSNCSEEACIDDAILASPINYNFNSGTGTGSPNTANAPIKAGYTLMLDENFNTLDTVQATVLTEKNRWSLLKTGSPTGFDHTLVSAFFGTSWLARRLAA
jgi:hypothetical protein